MTFPPVTLRLVIGLVVLVLAVVFIATGKMDLITGGLFAALGVGLMVP